MLRDCTAIRIPKLPKMDLPPPNLFRSDIATTSSARAPPIPTSPLPISSIDNSENFLSASARILQLAASATIAILVRRLILVLSIIFRPRDSSNKPPPSAISPLAISARDKSASFFIAPARIATAAATRTSDTPAFTNPVDPSPLKVLEIEPMVMLSIPSIAPIAAKDFTIWPTSSLEIDRIAAERIPTAIAIPTIDETLIPSWNETKVS